VDWKWGNFSMLPIVFGTFMAILDLVMMGSIKMIHNGTLSVGVGIPLAVGMYALEPLFFLKAMNYEGMAVMNLIWNLMSDILVTLQALLIFGETIKGIRWVAVGMAVVSLSIFAYTDDQPPKTDLFGPRETMVGR
jgi:multidrug transporter EmrE-like cation transporter